MRLVLAALALLAFAGAAPLKTADPMAMLSWMPGDWTCTAAMMGKTQTYKAHFAYGQGGRWMTEDDTWAGGGDRVQFTYVRSKQVWRAVVTESDGNVTVFVAPDTGLAHIAYASVYPDASMRDTLDRVTTRKYTMQFVQKTPKATITGHDVCIKT